MEMWIPEPSDLDWMKGVYAKLREGGQWIAPMSGQVFQKNEKKLIWMNEELGDHFRIFERSRIIGRFLGIKVIKKSDLENKNEDASFQSK